MKTIIFLIGLLAMVSCQTTKMVVPPMNHQSKTTQVPTHVSEQRMLAHWLMGQPQEVVDEFKKDFTFSGKEVGQFIDTLRKN